MGRFNINLLLIAVGVLVLCAVWVCLGLLIRDENHTIGACHARGGIALVEDGRYICIRAEVLR